ncbi:23S rRNA (uracil(1939)-C(5))-methyltransferase RlmD [Shewanella sp.]|uniref:23S rRNA (uracil(1939)-C(5))-methyltransferase RlmD n=1 Tax=Shewanella sp. TaxID=50422 RepID=UPI0040540036
MAQFFKEKANKSKQLSPKLSLNVTQLDHLGAGMAQHQGKVVFIAQALPGERVTAQFTDQKKSFAKAKLIKIEQKSPLRIDASCPHYGHCGGCDLQHLALDAQQTHKQQSLNELMVKLSGSDSIEPQVQVAPLVSAPWHYRRRARLATFFNNNDKSLKLGFRALSSNQIVPIEQCPVLAEPLSALIHPFAVLLSRLKAKASLGHLELTQADNGTFAVLRVTKVLPAADVRVLVSFALTHDIHLLLQDGNGELTDVSTVVPSKSEPALQVKPAAITLPEYSLSQGQINCQFTPGNFVQVNAEVNQRMVEQAVNWLDLQVGERVLDLFCGVGNFSLALANRGKILAGLEVIGVEGVPEMVQQARDNAKRNNLGNLSFYHADLSADLSNEKWLGKIDKLLLDPARAGAFESLQWLQKMKPKKVVYVSCNPASLARDSSVLLNQGYKLTQLCMIDMFPQTHHIEAMALFEIGS